MKLKIGSKESILILILVFTLLTLTACKPSVPGEEIAIEDLRNYFEGILEEQSFIAVDGHLDEYTIDDNSVEIKTDENSHMVYFEVDTVEYGGTEGSDYLDYYEPMIKKTAIYSVRYILSDKKEWELQRVDEVEQLYCMPLEGVRENLFINRMLSANTDMKFVSQESDLENLRTEVIVDTFSKSMLIDESVRKAYTFTFDENGKKWNLIDEKNVSEGEYKYKFDKYPDWMLTTDKNDEGGRTHIGMKIKYNEDKKTINMEWSAGYIDSYGRRFKISDINTWHGSISPDDPRVFVSTESSEKLKIINDGTAVSYDAHEFYLVK